MEAKRARHNAPGSNLKEAQQGLTRSIVWYRREFNKTQSNRKPRDPPDPWQAEGSNFEAYVQSHYLKNTRCLEARHSAVARKNRIPWRGRSLQPHRKPTAMIPTPQWPHGGALNTMYLFPLGNQNHKDYFRRTLRQRRTERIKLLLPNRVHRKMA